jgi:hypothetical protein
MKLGKKLITNPDIELPVGLEYLKEAHLHVNKKCTATKAEDFLNLALIEEAL